MENTHTPGPWGIGLETDNERAQVIAADGSHICYVECDPVMHNAALIAAAPDLLAAATRAVMALEAIGAPNCEAAKECRAALARAA